jgi:hypothetical protein
MTCFPASEVERLWIKADKAAGQSVRTAGNSMLHCGGAHA